MNKYDRINRPLSKIFTKMLLDFAQKAENREEEKNFILMAKTVWNISYFDKKAQKSEINTFINSLHIEESKSEKYRNMMMKGIKDKKKATEKYELKDVWTRVENLKVRKKYGIYKIEFEFDFYE